MLFLVKYIWTLGDHLKNNKYLKNIITGDKSLSLEGENLIWKKKKKPIANQSSLFDLIGLKYDSLIVCDAERGCRHPSPQLGH